MPTTIRLDDQLFKSAKRLARDTGRSLAAVIEDALRETLARQATSKQTRKPVKLTTVSGHEVRPGVDLNDSAALLAVMEHSRGASSLFRGACHRFPSYPCSFHFSSS
jgi:hypothetical protein